MGLKRGDFKQSGTLRYAYFGIICHAIFNLIQTGPGHTVPPARHI